MTKLRCSKSYNDDKTKLKTDKMTQNYAYQKFKPTKPIYEKKWEIWIALWPLKKINQELKIFPPKKTAGIGVFTGNSTKYIQGTHSNTQLF